MTENKAPERILVITDYDGTHEGTWISVAPYDLPIEYTGMEPQYIRSDLYYDLMRAADELAEVIGELQDALSEAREGQIVNYGESAITTYQQTKEKMDA